MKRLSFFLFSSWVLLIPYTVVTAVAIGMAIDKILAPFLILLYAVLYMSGNYRLNKDKRVIIILAFFFFMLRNISFVTHWPTYLSVIWEDAISFGYFCLPIFYMDNIKNVRRVNKLIAINAIAGCVSVFLVALKLITLPVERFSQSRIGFESIEKSIGLFTAYGDLAQYGAFFLLVAFILPNTLLANRKYKTILRLGAVLVLIMGLIGAQSRNYLLSQVMALISVTIIFMSHKGRVSRFVFPVMMAVSVILVLSVMPFVFDDFVAFLSGFGGSQAEQTAGARLQQYTAALAIIREFPLFGIDAEFFMTYPTFAHGIHNLWLGQLTRGGLVCTILLVTVLVKLWRRSMRLTKYSHTRPYGLVGAGYLVALMVSTLFYPADSTLFWCLLGVNAGMLYTVKHTSPVDEKINFSTDILHETAPS